MNVHGQWYLPWMQTAGQVVIPTQQPAQPTQHQQASAQQALSNSASVSASAQQQLLQQQYMQQQQQLLKYLNQGNCDMWRVFFVKKADSYLNQC